MADQTPPPPPPQPDFDEDAQGTLVHTWPDGIAIHCALGQADKFGRYDVSVFNGAGLVTTAVLNLGLLADREKLTVHCNELAGSDLAWLARLVQVADTLRTRQAPTAILDVTQLSMVTPETIEFWWKPYLPRGRPVCIEGDPGISKSTLALKITAHLTSGAPFPNVYDYGPLPQPFPPQNVCIASSEDGPGDSILPRVLANGGDPSRVYLLSGWQRPDGTRGALTMQMLDRIDEALWTYQPAIIIFDPIQSYLGPHVDMNSATDTRPILDAVAALCKSYGCTPVYIRHIGKAAKSRAIYAGLGSIDIIASMRSALFVGQDPDDPERRIMAHSKSNNAMLGPSMAYKLVSMDCAMPKDDGSIVTVEVAQLLWDGKSGVRADDLAAPPAVQDDEAKGALEQAKDFLEDLLDDGPVRAEAVQAAATKNGVSRASLRRAKVALNVESRRRRGETAAHKETVWEWCLPDTVGG